MSKGYELLDSGSFQKLERFGAVVLSRPCAQAVWQKTLPESAWRQATATFFRGRTKKQKSTTSFWCNVG
jgi:23S rRNA (cytosine1962-C5)-methyltransferase